MIAISIPQEKICQAYNPGQIKQLRVSRLYNCTTKKADLVFELVDERGETFLMPLDKEPPMDDSYLVVEFDPKWLPKEVGNGDD